MSPVDSTAPALGLPNDRIGAAATPAARMGWVAAEAAAGETGATVVDAGATVMDAGATVMGAWQLAVVAP